MHKILFRKIILKHFTVASFLLLMTSSFMCLIYTRLMICLFYYETYMFKHEVLYIFYNQLIEAPYFCTSFVGIVPMEHFSLQIYTKRQSS
jgi:lysylphosphatidylglycerol synthetase-like protein (DUF2156 family)